MGGREIPVKPPTFRFKMRLVDSTGKAIADRPYEISWGHGAYADFIQSRTNATGHIEHDFDARFDSGKLNVGVFLSDGQFAARWAIPLEAVKPPLNSDVFAFVSRSNPIFDLAWRLSNLGHVSDFDIRQFPFGGDTVNRIIRAVLRF